MRVDTLQLENFRCFERLSIDLHERVTVLVGNNGAGKSAVLDALAIALGAWFRGTALAEGEDRSIETTDARLVRQEGAGNPTANPSFPVRVSAVGSMQTPPRAQAALPFPGGGPERVDWTRELSHLGGRTSTSGPILDAARYTEARATEDASARLPLIAYYATGRMWVQKRERRTRHEALDASRAGGYAACLEIASDHKLFTAWMARQAGALVQRQPQAREAGQDFATVRSEHLTAVERAAVTCLEGARRFYFSIAHEELRVEFDDGRLLPFASLSDGQCSMVTLAADLAWRAVQLNPSLGADAPRQAEGVVLIDEIELHLHPAWQRSVLARLTGVFPRVQFVVTTHSPQVVSTARPEWLRIVHPDGSVARVEHTLGRDSNALLQDVFGTDAWPAEVLARVREIESLLTDGKLEDARGRLRALEADLGPEDQHVVGLGWELRDLEVGGASGAE